MEKNLFQKKKKNEKYEERIIKTNVKITFQIGYINALFCFHEVCSRLKEREEEHEIRREKII